MLEGQLSWEAPVREPEPPAPIPLAIAAGLVLATLAAELGALAYLLLKLV